MGAFLRDEVITIEEFLNLLMSNCFVGLPGRFSEMLGPAVKVLAPRPPAVPDDAGAVLDALGADAELEEEAVDAELEEDDTCAPDDVLDDVGGAWVVTVDDDDFENKC